jgi:cell division protease FtsH
VTAYHEAGHALVACFTPGADPLHKVTIIPRGRALGLTMQLPTEDKYTYKKHFVEAQIAILMGGRVAEELTLDDITTGAGNDIERATEMARRMVCEWGMSELGPLSYGSKEEPVFLGREFPQRADYSEDTAVQIDREVVRIVQSGYDAARAILSRYRDVLDHMAQDLLERESMDGEEVYKLIRDMTGHEPARPREAPSGEGLYIGQEGPETVVKGPTAASEHASSGQGVDAGPTEAKLEESLEVEEPAEEPEVASAQRRTAQAPATVPSTEKPG